MLEITGLRKVFNRGTVNEKVALNGLNITVNDGDFVTVIGGNGAGKSTMLNAICGVFPVDEGKIVLDGNDITALPEYKRAKFLGRVFQDPMMVRRPIWKFRRTLRSPAAGESRGCCARASPRRKRNSTAST